MASQPDKPDGQDQSPGPAVEHQSADARDDQARSEELYKQAFQSTLGAFSNAEEETHALIARLVSFGRISREEGARMFTDIRQLVEDRRKELEDRIQFAINAAMKRLTIPTQEDLSEVAQKLAELERRVEALDDMEPPQEVPRTPVARRPGAPLPPAKKKR